MHTARSLKPPQAHLSALLHEAGMHMHDKKYGLASACYAKALDIKPNDPHLHYCYGSALHHNKELLKAIHAYSQALLLNSELVEAFENLAEAQFELQFFDDALISLRAAVELKPNRPLTRARLAKVLIRLGCYKEAIDESSVAITLAPDVAINYMIRSNAFRGLNNISESIADLECAIALDPNNAEFVYNLSFDLLLTEDFKKGWLCYESRFQTESFLKNSPPLKSPRWTGVENLKDKTILVYPEQGLGDQIQFGRYALILQEIAASVILLVDPPLVNIMQSMHPNISVISAQCPISNLPTHDFHIPLMSLLGALNADITNILCATNYITPSANVKNLWAGKFKNKSKLQIGLTWSGNQLHVNDHNRSMMLCQLQRLFEFDAEWHILQTQIRPEDEALLAYTPLIDWRSELITMEDTSGLLQQMDLLITVDTSVAHLAAAMGRPTWIMLPFNPDFRWLLDRDDSPWYSSVRLFRQSSPKNWDSVVTSIITSLTKNFPTYA